MRLRSLLSGLAVAGLLAAGVGQASAGTYSFQPSPTDLNDLDHYKYYKWGVTFSIPTGEEIYEAKLVFDNIANWDSNPNVLYGQLLASNPVGTKELSDEYLPDNINGGNALLGDGVQLFKWENLPTTPQDLTYTFTSEQLTALNNYAADGTIGLGFDPDCHFWNDGITFVIKTRPETEEPPPNGAVPEPVTATLGVFGFAALALATKRRSR